MVFKSFRLIVLREFHVCVNFSWLTQNPIGSVTTVEESQSFTLVGISMLFRNKCNGVNLW